MDLSAVYAVSKKLKLYLAENDLSVLKLSQLIPDIKYQTLKRIVEFDNAESLPNISSIISLAAFFGCTLSELTSENIVIPMSIYESIADYLKVKSSGVVQLSIQIDEYLKIRNPKGLFALRASLAKQANKKIVDIVPLSDSTYNIHIFSTMEEVEYDGYYMVKISGQACIINVISVSSTFLMVEDDKSQISKFNISDIDILAKYITQGIVLKNPKKVLVALQK